jgi:hypothetical protein
MKLHNHLFAVTLTAAAVLAFAGAPAALAQSEKKPEQDAKQKQAAQEKAKQAEQINLRAKQGSKERSPEEEKALQEMLAKRRAALQQQNHAAPAANPMTKGVDNENGPLSFDVLNHDFGIIPDTNEVTHVFKFTNNSDKTLRITARGSCGCTVPTLAKDSYAPGEAGEITAKFNPKRRNGHQTKQITVMFDDPEMKNMQLEITADVQALVLVDPPKGDLRELRTETGGTTTFTVTGRKEGFQLTAVQSKSSDVLTSISEPRQVEKDGVTMTAYDVTVTVPPGAAVGNISEQLQLVTNDERADAPPYIFSAQVVGDLRAQPEHVYVRTFTPDTAFTTTARIDSRDGHDFHIVGIDVEGRNADQLNVVTDFEALPEGQHGYTLTLSGITPSNAGSYEGEVLIRTDLPNQEDIRVRFVTNVRRTQASAVR